MSLTSDSGACSESSSSTDGCAREEEDVCDPEEEEVDEEEAEEEEYDEEDDGPDNMTATPLMPASAAPVIRSYDDGIEFVSDTYAASAAFAAACDRHHRRQGGGGRARGGRGGDTEGRQSASRASRAHSHHRERARRERFIELYGKLQTSIPALQVGKRVTHRRILTETAVYLAGTIAQIKARRRVNKLRALLAQLEADAAYMRRFSGLPPSMERQHLQQQHPHHHQHTFRSSSSNSSRRVILTPDDSAMPDTVTIGDCFLIG